MTDPADHPPTIHATAVLVAGLGILIRGASGSGKSRLAVDLIDLVRLNGLDAALVADDRVILTAAHGRLAARPPASLAGLVEERGIGIGSVPFEPAVIVRIVVDLCKDPPRLPEAVETTTVIGEIRLPRLVVKVGDPGAPGLVLRFLRSARSRIASFPGCRNAAQNSHLNFTDETTIFPASVEAMPP